MISGGGEGLNVPRSSFTKAKHKSLVDDYASRTSALDIICGEKNIKLHSQSVLLKKQIQKNMTERH